MNKVAIIVQRYHEDTVGGSESLAWHYATLLRDAYEVDLLTTTAVDISDWANVLPEGSTKKDGVNIVRFPVTVGRNAYWGRLHRRLLAGFSRFTPGRSRNPDNPFQLQWSIPLQEEFILNQGPYSEPMMQFIENHWSDYRRLIFLTYLYPTTYFGLQRVPPGHALFAPTLHCEPTAYLSAYRHAAHRARALLWLTEAEQRVGQKLWGELSGWIVALGIDTARRQAPAVSPCYLLYCGRVDPNKGFPELFEYFIKFTRTFPGKLRLVITGKDDMKVPDHPDIEFRGFVLNEEKLSLMAGATIYISPSPNESFSIVTLEAMAQGTPVLANGSSEVLVDHINTSGAGRIYRDYDTFAATLSELLSEKNKLREMGVKGRRYAAQYDVDKIRKNLIEAIEGTPVPGERRISETPAPEATAPVEAVAADAPAMAPHMLTVNIEEEVRTVPLVLHTLSNGSGADFYVRPLTYDAQILEDVVVVNEYDLPKKFQSHDIVVDIGAHIGSFSYAVLERGAGKVYSYEAHPINRAIASRNLERFGDRVSCCNIAVWRSDEESKTLYNDFLKGLQQPNTGGISLLWNNEGVPVKTTSLDDLLFEVTEGLTKTVRLLKLDCEGSEYPILYTASHLRVVQEICGEYHIIKPEEVPTRAQVGTRRDQFNGAGLKAFLEDQGFSVELEPHGANDGLFHARRKTGY